MVDVVEFVRSGFKQEPIHGGNIAAVGILNLVGTTNRYLLGTMVVSIDGSIPYSENSLTTYWKGEKAGGWFRLWFGWEVGNNTECPVFPVCLVNVVRNVQMGE